MPDSLESSQTDWKVSGESGKFYNSVKYNIIYTVGKVSELSREFPDSLESFWTIWKVYNQLGKFPDTLERQRYVITWTQSLEVIATNKFPTKCDVLVNLSQ